MCLSNDSSLQLLTPYCEQAKTGCQHCGKCMDHYCVKCKHYTPLNLLMGQVCYPHKSSQVESAGYNLCLSLDINVGTAPPTSTAKPTTAPMITTAPTITASPSDYVFPIAVPLCPIIGPSAEPTVAPTSGRVEQLPTISPWPTAATFFPCSEPMTFPTVSPATEAVLEKLLSSVSLDDGEALHNPGSPQSMAFKELCQSPLLSEYSDKDIIQWYALMVFYYSTSGDQWMDSTGWLSNNNVCTWDFVSCNSDSLVTRIVAPKNNIYGPLPPEMYLLDSLGKKSVDRYILYCFPFNVTSESIFILFNLGFLGLDNNCLSGQVPSELGLLTNLSMWITI